MRVVHLLATGYYSGAENVALNIMRWIPEVEQIYVSPNGPIQAIVEGKNLRFYGIKTANLIELKKALKELKPDVVHAHDPRMSCLAALCASPGIKIVSHLHNNPKRMEKLNAVTVIYHACAARFSSILAVSKSVIEGMWWSSRFTRKWVLLRNCIDIEETREKAKAPAPQTDILFVGRLTEQKDPLRFLKLAKDIVEKFGPVRVGVVGDGELRSECESYVKKNGLERYVVFHGFQPNPYAFMAKTRVLLMPSKWEGFGLVAVEAMCLGIPIISSGLGGLREIICDEKEFGCTTDQEYIDRVDKLLKDKDYLSRVSKNALIQAELLSNRKKYIETVKTVYGCQKN